MATPRPTQAEVDALFQQANALYSQIYRIRQNAFVPSHIGLGTWGKTTVSTTQAARIAELTKERSKVYSKAKRLQKQLAS